MSGTGAGDWSTTPEYLAHIAVSFEVRVVTSRKDVGCLVEVVEVSKTILRDSKNSGTSD